MRLSRCAPRCGRSVRHQTQSLEAEGVAWRPREGGGAGGEAMHGRYEPTGDAGG